MLAPLTIGTTNGYATPINGRAGGMNGIAGPGVAQPPQNPQTLGSSNVPGAISNPAESNHLATVDIDLSQQHAYQLKTDLCRYVRTAWDAARDARSKVTHEIYLARKEREFQYDPTKLAAIRKTAGSDVFVGLADFKCRMVTAFLKDLLLGQGEQPWTLDPTPDPDIPAEYDQFIDEALVKAREEYEMITGEPPDETFTTEYRAELDAQIIQEIKKDAKVGAERMGTVIEDRFVEGNFYKAFGEVLDDLVTAPTAFIKGPIVKKKPKLQWKKDDITGSWGYDVSEQLVTEWARIDPLLIFPAENSQHINHRYLCEIGRMSRRELQNLRGAPGVNDSVINMLLERHYMGGLNNWLGMMEYAGSEVELEYRHPDSTFDMLIYWGDIDGQMLLDWGMEGVEAQKVYGVCIHMVGDYVIKARLNYHPLNYKPYHASSFDKRPGHIWGRSVCELIRPLADMANANARALANNMGIASGPQVDVNVDRLSKNENIDVLVPWKRWFTKNDPSGTNIPAVRFWQPEDRSNVLIEVFKFWSDLANEYLGFSQLSAGVANPASASRTASGMSLLLNQSNKFLKQVIANIDCDYLESSVEAQYYHEMQYNPNGSIKLDVTPRARGAISLAIREALQVRRNEFLQTTANPIDTQILGPDGRAEILREVAKTLDMDIDRIIPKNRIDALNRLSDIPSAEMLLQQQIGGAPTSGAPTSGIPTGQPPTGQLALPPGQPGEVLPGTQVPTTDFFSPPGQ